MHPDARALRTGRQAAVTQKQSTGKNHPRLGCRFATEQRAAEVQVKALATGRRLIPVPTEVARRTYLQMRQGDAESAKLHLASVKHLLQREEADFAT